ncbi:MAG: hypothetical protein GXP56_05855 [Deltaproteobacteria bacterium]|nr:hypothetical protein [Deltaproteobacteria bacterium]
MTFSNNKSNRSGKTILVTDSGLGGMSVFARIANLVFKKSPWQDVSMIYFNAWPTKERGYNHFKTMDQKARVFNNALNAMARFKPDMILIACNTLSVIYPFTRFSRDAGTRVFGIVDHGVQMIHESLMADKDSQAIIFGTPTTIAEKTHQKKLSKMGIDPGRITGQGCTDLAGKIERNPFDGSVAKMIHANVSTAVSNMRMSTGKIFAALFCTHFGYSRDIFQKALSKKVNGEVIILNPNEKMADQVFEGQAEKNISSPVIKTRVVSRVCLEPARIDAYTKLLKGVSPLAVKALARYEWKADLFDI